MWCAVVMFVLSLGVVSAVVVGRIDGGAVVVFVLSAASLWFLCGVVVTEVVNFFEVSQSSKIVEFLLVASFLSVRCDRSNAADAAEHCEKNVPRHAIPGPSSHLEDVWLCLLWLSVSWVVGC